MKIAFIAHTTARGGAAISNTTNLDYLIDNGPLEPKECLLVLPEGSEYGMYAKYVGKIPTSQVHLPFSWIFVGAAPGIHRKAYRMFKEIISAIIFLIDYNRFLKREGITHIYLNSMVLWCLLPVLPQNLNFIIHIREQFDDSLESRVAIWTIRNFADTIICINEQTSLPFKDLYWKTRQVQNPVDMYAARQLRSSRDEIKNQMGIPKDTFVISMFAPIGLQKGYDFLAGVMNLVSKNKKILFLSVGAIDKDATILYNQLIQYPNFKHFDEQENMDKLYAITDVVIRCEDYFPFGRTVLEGIYAGCITLLPFVEGDDTREQQQYLNQVYLYQSRNGEQCAATIDRLYHQFPQGIINNGFEPTGNVKEVSEKLIAAIKVKFEERDG